MVYSETIAKFNEHKELKKILKSNKISNEMIVHVINSGYWYLPGTLDYSYNGTNAAILDTFYGASDNIGLINIDQFIRYLKTGNYVANPQFRSVYRIKSKKDVINILNKGRYKYKYYKGQLSFRGQVQEYTIARQIPNPFLKHNSGSERLIIPAYWRKFSNNWNDRFSHIPRSIFTSNFVESDELIYYGINNWRNLAIVNIERYGDHSFSDLEDFHDYESREYYKRYLNIKALKYNSIDVPLIEQHYGFKTTGLDVTFDLDTAMFFASNRFRLTNSNRAFYEPVAKGQHQGVVYCFYFRDPPLERSSDLITKIPSFDHIPPTRPLKQKCALPFFDSTSINEACLNLIAIFYLDSEFENTGIPSARQIFPNSDEDPFYNAILNVKSIYPEFYNEIIEYDFQQFY